MATRLCLARRREATSPKPEDDPPEPDGDDLQTVEEIEFAERREGVLDTRAQRSTKEGIARQAHERADLIATERFERLVLLVVFVVVAAIALVLTLAATIAMLFAPDLRLAALAGYGLVGGLTALLKAILRARPVAGSGDDGQSGGGDA